MKKALFTLNLVFASFLGITQSTFPVNGVHDERPLYTAFVNATIYAQAGKKLDTATLLIKEGRVIAIGNSVDLPKGCVIVDCQGLMLYPSFVDPYAGFNVAPKKKGGTPSPTVVNNASNWNPAIHPEYSYTPTFPLDQKIQDDWLASGVGVVNVHHQDGIMRGSSAVFHMGIDQANEALIAEEGMHHFSFSKGSSTFDYPSSFMGAIALIRQTLYDAQWYMAEGKTHEINRSLGDLAQMGSRKNVFELNHPLSYRNIQMLSKEFDVEFILKGTGKEYLIAEHLSPSTNIIVPVGLPKAFEIQDPLDARMISLDELKHWEAAPFNAYFLKRAGHHIALSRDTIKTSKQFLNGLKKLSHSGLTHDEILAMLTTEPAKFLGLTGKVGSLQVGAYANFFLSENLLTEDGFQVIEHWNRGERVYHSTPAPKALMGTYNLVVDQQDYLLTLQPGEKNSLKANLTKKGDDKTFPTTITLADELITLVVLSGSEQQHVLFQLTGKFSLGGSMVDGKGTTREGQWITWAGIKNREKKTPEAEQKAPNNDSVFSVPRIAYPNTAFGFDSLPLTGNFVITNAVVWTCSSQGVLTNADVWVEEGKIKAVGSGALYPEGLKRIDAKGRHLTPGLIDEHSHIALRGGVNEWAQASSAEVKISDAIDPWSIHIYRQLGGGVTSAQLLHGSANPIGGQSALVKLKWGKTAEEMLYSDAVGFIKFALGENVKRSNSHEDKGRFPLTRMGVEQTYVDAFTRAQEYRMQRASTPALSTSKKGGITTNHSLIRKDLQLDAMVEILEGNRFISCHSYVQSEILMLMQVADSFGFHVNTFTHILEGYKVAPQMLAHGAMGSTFSDWWAYKFEVNDAIPYNAALMTKVGVVTAINSDDAEMGRRLNQEAAKTIKYGGISPEDALKMVTINPARMLHLDHRVGSIEVGKDADLVLWSADPLSVYAHVDQTYIEGVKYYDHSEQNRLQAKITKERARIIEQMILEKSAKKRPVQGTEEKLYHCDTILEVYE